MERSISERESDGGGKGREGKCKEADKGIKEERAVEKRKRDRRFIGGFCVSTLKTLWSIITLAERSLPVLVLFSNRAKFTMGLKVIAHGFFYG